MSTVLEKLKQELAETREVKRKAIADERDLCLAIAAIEGQSSPSDKVSHSTAPLRAKRARRGAVSAAVLDCIRSGIGAPQQIQAELIRRGIKTTRQNVSSTIYRLGPANKGLIEPDLDSGTYVIRRTKIKPNNEGLTGNREGPSAGEGPLCRNGEAGSHPA